MEFDFNWVRSLSTSWDQPKPPPSLPHTPRSYCSLYSTLSLFEKVDSGASVKINYFILWCEWVYRLFFWTAPWLIEIFGDSTLPGISWLALYYFNGCSLHKLYSFDYLLSFSYFTSISSSVIFWYWASSSDWLFD